MDQLKGKVVNVVLTIQEGKCMESIKNLAFISANFNGRVLDSDAVPADDCPAFNTNLVWEIEKKNLRKIRSSNQPLRVECYSLDAQNRREKFGHVLLDLRSAQIIEEEDQQVPFRWQKLLGVRNKKRNSVPELYVSLTIRNHLVERESSDEIVEPEARPDDSIPINYLEDGYIVVGDHEDTMSDFSLNIVVKSASNLDLLLPEILVFHHNKHKYSMCIKTFGIPIKTKQFSKELHDKIVFEEKIVVRLLSKWETLQMFFRDEKFEVGFYCGSDLLGTADVTFEGLGNVNERLLTSAVFRFPSPNGIVPTGKEGRRPSLTLEFFVLKNSDEVTTTIVEEPDIVESHKASGDHYSGAEDTMLTTPCEDMKEEFQEWRRQQVEQFEEWRESERFAFHEELRRVKESEIQKAKEELDSKKLELEDNIKKCKELQTDLQQKLEDLRLAKALRKKRKSSTNLLEIIEENQRKFGDCEKELLIDYISNLQSDNDNLKAMVNKHKQELEGIQKTALTKEQTANLLQELKGLEEKFVVAQQTKTYFKEEWKKACEEIHELKSEDYRQLQDQLRERREELSQLSLEYIEPEPGNILSF